MPLTVDTSRAFRTNQELASLVTAAIAGTEHDETQWLELKSALDLSTKAGQFAVARAILGMSNRDPDLAAQWCEGTAYVVAGADHDGCHGITTVDFALLENGLAPYLGTGADAPRWSSRYIEIGGKSVLVITVEASQYGDRIKPLRKQFDTARAGAIYVRGQAKTETATPGEIAMLEDRLTRAVQAPAMGLSVVGSVDDPGLAWVEDYTNSATAAGWVNTERSEVMAGAPPARPKQTTLAGQLFEAHGSLGGPTDRRPAFEKEVNAYLQTCQVRLPAVVRGEACRSSVNKLRITATNPEQITMGSVRIVVEVDAEKPRSSTGPRPRAGCRVARSSTTHPSIWRRVRFARWPCTIVTSPAR